MWQGLPTLPLRAGEGGLETRAQREFTGREGAAEDGSTGCSVRPASHDIEDSRRTTRQEARAVFLRVADWPDPPDLLLREKVAGTAG
jgi:hypothetical protein